MTENREQRSRLWAAAILAMVLAVGIGIIISAASVGASAPTTNLPAQGSGGLHLPAGTPPPDTPTPTAILMGHVIWQGISQPNARNVQPISLTLSMGSTEINYPTQNTDASGFFTVSVAGLSNGTYDYRAKGPKNLANAGTVTLTGVPTTQLEIGVMKAGDANNDNIVDTIDYAILRASFGRPCGDPLFDARADFDNNCIVNSTDFGLQKGNFAIVGAPPVGPVPPSSGDAFLTLQPGSTAGNCPAPPNGGTVQLGCRFVLDLMLNMGSVPDGLAQQSYLTFTSSIIQNARVSSIATSCVPTSTVTGDLTVFDAILQNEVCNDQPGGCTFRGVPVGKGSMALAAGALTNPSSGGTFRLAQIGLCAVAEGEGVLHWRFSPPAPRSRHTDIVDASGNLVQDQALFADYIINVVGPSPTSTPTPSPTDTPIPTNTSPPTNTRTVTPTSTPTPSPTDTPTPCPTCPTNTPVPAGTINGHLTWQGVASANYPVVTGTLTLCVSGSAQSFGPFNTDTNGNFTLITGLSDGVYHWFIKGGRHISNSSPTDGAALVISGGQGTQEFGLQKSGNTNTDNVVNASDFGNLHVLFGMSGARSADFDYNLLVNILDFGILKSNFGQIGHTLTCP